MGKDNDLIVIPGSANHSGLRRSPTLLAGRFELVPASRVEESLSDHFCTGPWQVEPIYDGYGAIVYGAKCINGQNMIVKIGVFEDTHSPAEDFIYSYLLLGIDSSLPLAQPVLLDISGKKIPYPYIAMRRLPGNSLLSLYEEHIGPEAFSAVSQVAEALAFLHVRSLKVKGFGPINRTTAQQILEHGKPKMLQGQWSNKDKYYSGAFRRNVCSHQIRPLFSQKELSVLSAIANKKAPSTLTTGCIHGDPSLRNFLFEKDRLTGVIDGTGRIGWFEEDFAACCVFVWQQGHKMTREASAVLVGTFYERYVKTSGDRPEPRAFQSLVLRKALSRICTGIKLGDPSGVKSMVSLVKIVLAHKSQADGYLPWVN